MKERKAEKRERKAHRPKGHRSIRSKKSQYPQNRKTCSRLFLGPSGESEIFLTPKRVPWNFARER